MSEIEIFKASESDLLLRAAIDNSEHRFVMMLVCVLPMFMSAVYDKETRRFVKLLSNGKEIKL